MALKPKSDDIKSVEVAGVGRAGVGGAGVGLPSTDRLSLDLQFAADKTLTARKGPTPVFTRASGATQVGATGLIEYAPENLVLQSQNFSNATWQKLNGATVGATVADPFGGTSAYTLNFSSTNYSRFEQWSPGSQTGDVITVSVYLRADSNTTIFTRLALETFATFNVTTNWQRFEYTATQQAIGLYPQLNNYESGAKTIYAYGFQVERFSSARTYIPTTTASVYGARFDHDPVTLASRGLLIEESRTNLVFPSDTLTTQTRTVTATAHTLSFYGTGTVVLSGVAVATVTGTGAYPTRTTLTFTPTAGSLIMTVTGSVTQAQLEEGAFATSYIPTTTASVVRSADICTITGSSFTGMYNQSEGTLLTQSTKTSTNSNSFIAAMSDNSFNNSLDLRYSAVTTASSLMNFSNVNQFTGFSGAITSGSSPKQAIAYKLNDCAYSANGASVIIDTLASIPTFNRVDIGMSFVPSLFLNGHIASIRYYKKRLANAKIQALTV